MTPHRTASPDTIPPRRPRQRPDLPVPASVQLAAGHDSHEKGSETEHKLDVKGNRDEIERTTKT